MLQTCICCMYTDIRAERFIQCHFYYDFGFHWLWKQDAWAHVCATFGFPCVITPTYPTYLFPLLEVQTHVLLEPCAGWWEEKAVTLVLYWRSHSRSIKILVFIWSRNKHTKRTKTTIWLLWSIRGAVLLPARVVNSNDAKLSYAALYWDTKLLFNSHLFSLLNNIYLTVLLFK